MLLLVLLNMLILILLLLVLLMLVSLTAIADHLFKLLHNICGNLLEQQASGVDISLVARIRSLRVRQYFGKIAARRVDLPVHTIGVCSGADIHERGILGLSHRERCLV